MTLDLDATSVSIVLGAAGTLAAPIVAVIRHLYLARETERAARLADAERYTAAMLDVQSRLRAEDAREKAELQAKLDQYTAPPSRPGTPPRRKPRQ